MKVLFEDKYGYIRQIADDVDNAREAMKVIMAFLEKHNYRSYYQRTWYDEDRHMMKVDVGSHSEFFYYGEDNKND